MREVNIQKLFHCTYSLNYHFVLVTKYRRRCLTKAMLDRLQEIAANLCIAWGGTLLEMNGEADHVHLLVEMNPKASPSSIAANFKTVTSRLLRKEFDDVLSKTYRRPVLWSRAYFVSSCGGAPLSVIKQYIEQQEKPS